MSGWQNPNNHNAGAGARVQVLEEGGNKTLYGHLNPDQLPATGTKLKAGDEIADYADPTNGHSNGPHVHVQRFDSHGNIVDPGNISPVEGGVRSTPYGVRDRMHPNPHQGNDYVAPSQ